MTKVLVLYYSSRGHIETMARAIADGARKGGAEVAIKRVPELFSDDVRKSAGSETDLTAPIATVDELPGYDAIIIGTPTRYGGMATQMKNFLDQTGSLWLQDKLVGKVGGVFTSSSSQHGGQETTIQSTHAAMLHLGMVIVGLPYSFKGQLVMSEVTGGSPYGASTIASNGNHSDRQPTANELEGARYQGRHVAQIARKLAGLLAP